MAAKAKHVAIISGGAGDIGRAIALDLARLGADIAIGDVVDRDDRVASLESALKSLGRKLRFDAVDITEPAAVEQWLSIVEESLGVPDWIIPNAAIAPRTSFDKFTPTEWKQCCDVTLNGAYYLAVTGANRLVRHKLPGRIVFVGSWAAHAPHTNIPAYSVAKAGVRMLAQVMALHYARDRILVNEVAPGYVDAGLSKVGFDADPQKRQQCEAHVPVGELMSAEDVALHVAYLCNDRNRFMTGATLLADGGLSLLTRLSPEDRNRSDRS